VNGHLAGGLLMGMLALVLGVGLILGALRRRRHMQRGNAPTYAATGGVVYTVFQVGCAGLLILAGIVLLVVMLLTRSATRP
jgi:hypothetical protein